MILSGLLILFCCIIIWRASDGFEVASAYLGRNLSEGVRGATINAIGSSMPEFFTTLFFLFILQDRDGFASGIGTTAGSAIFNGMIIPALVILVVLLKGMTSKVVVSRKVLFRDGLALLLCELVLIFLLGGDTLNWIHGFILMAMYVVYTSYMLYSMKPELSERSEDDFTSMATDDNSNFLTNLLTLDLEALFIKNEIQKRNAWTLLTGSTIIIGIACLLLAKSCEWLGAALHIPTYFVAIILASAATSVPDTILSVRDAQKGNYDDAVSNALGSNIFDVCFALGFPLFLFTLLFGPITMSATTIVNVSELRILLFLLTFLCFIIYVGQKSMGIWSALFLLLLYALFTWYILGRSFETATSEQISSYLQYINNLIDYLRFWK